MVQLGKTWRKLLILSMKLFSYVASLQLCKKIAYNFFFLLHLKGDPTARKEGKTCFGLTETFF